MSPKKKRITTGGLNRKFGTQSCLKKNMWKKGRPPKKTQRKFVFHVYVPTHAHQKNYFSKILFLN